MASKDSFGDRMKKYENATRVYLPSRTYTLIRLDGVAFHTFTKNMDFPIDVKLRETMILTCRKLFESIPGCKLAYTQSDEITLLLVDFEDTLHKAWFDGNLQKIVSNSAAMATAFFNKNYESSFRPAFFDSRAWTLSDPWEVYNTFLWRQQDCTRNALSMAASAHYTQKELNGKKTNDLNEMLFQKGINFNNYPTSFKRGVFVYRNDRNQVFVDDESPILSKDKEWFFKKIPLIEQPTF